jgi:indolepyruvate ferredoxin oxidoreductase
LPWFWQGTQIIAWYEQLLDEWLPRLGAENAATLAQIAASRLEIRGFGPVKEAAVHATKARIAALTAELATPP